MFSADDTLWQLRRTLSDPGVRSPASMGVSDTPPPPLPAMEPTSGHGALGICDLKYPDSLGRGRRLGVGGHWKAQRLYE